MVTIKTSTKLTKASFALLRQGQLAKERIGDGTVYKSTEHVS